MELNCEKIYQLYHWMCECESSKKRDPANYSTPTVVNILYLVGGMVYTAAIFSFSPTHSNTHTHAKASKQKILFRTTTHLDCWIVSAEKSENLSGRRRMRWRGGMEYCISLCFVILWENANDMACLLLHKAMNHHSYRKQGHFLCMHFSISFFSVVGVSVSISLRKRLLCAQKMNKI